jgi:hypothetical protein
MRKAGYAEGVNWLTRKYQGDEHSERDWRARVDVALKFLLESGAGSGVSGGFADSGDSGDAWRF